MTFSYDKRADVLYITFEKAPDEAYIYVENENGDILRMDKESGRVVGITLPFFSKRAKAGKIVVPEVGGVPFNAYASELISQ